ncbi:MAG: 2-ketoisovalerate ferredoxin oxidoreductase [Candidatus Altiarchaeales archaeon WOR_SM1_79]|nr:MAG: 2-ketoisovalerate ferredoxin oxidoreductase [Candidatus Altiarchaeales archaeon WOR_SM1_79]
MAKLTIPREEYMFPGHMGCLGCGGVLAMRYVLKALGKRTIVSVPACCWAIMSGIFPNSCLSVPMVNTAFETTGASVSGIRAALDALGIKDVNVLGWAGDGGTLDIGIQALSGAVERGHDIIYVCYDNEAYMNTGIQRSSGTPEGAWTTTTPVGKTKAWKKGPKKNMVEIMVAHKIPYTATAAISYPEDLIKKVTKAKNIYGPKYIHIFSPCPTGWRMPPGKSVEIARLAVQTCAFPLYEIENGVYNITKKPKKKPLKDYLQMQGRFRHLPEEEIQKMQKDVDREWEILLKKEEFTKSL